MCQISAAFAELHANLFKQGEYDKIPNDVLKRLKREQEERKMNKLQNQINEAKSEGVEIGNLSDGYHTFNELYDHRMILFAVVCKLNNDKAWKSKLHADGTMFDNFFVVGIETPDGQFTYHYHMEYWEHFNVMEVDYAPEWDGHTADDVTRLLSLEV